MAKKISQLTQATEVKSDDVTVIVQDGETKKLPLNMMVTKQDIENKKIAGLAKLDEIEATYENDTYTPTITVENKSSVKTGEGDEVDYSANVMDGHVKSAILKGNTLVNNIERIGTTSGYTTIHNNVVGFTIDTKGETTSKCVFTLSCTNKITAGAKYTVIVDVVENTLTREDDGQMLLKIVLNNYNQPNQGYVQINVGEIGLKVFEVTASSNVISDNAYMETPNNIKGRLTVNGISIIEGHNHNLTGFIEGMQSVKMPVLTTVGKNLFDGKLEYGIISGTNGRPYDSNDYVRTQDFIPINYEKITYTVINEQCGLSFYFYDKDKNFISSATMMNVNGNLSMPEGVAYLKFRTYPLSNESVTTNLNTQIQIEESSIVTEYEPYKSNILTANEEVELRGIGEVKDELDCLTGELTTRVGEYEINATAPKGSFDNNGEKTIYFYVNQAYLLSIPKVNAPLISNSVIQPILNDLSTLDVEGLHFTSKGHLQVRIDKSRLSGTSSNEVSDYLRENPITIQYQLATESIKTVDLMPSGTHPSTTPYCWKNGHIQLSSSGLLPNLEYSVVTSRAGQINQNATMIVKNDKRIFDLEILLAGGLVNTTYQALTLQNQVETGLSKVSLSSETEPDYLLYHMIMKLIEEKAYKLDDLTEKVSVFYLYEKLSDEQFETIYSALYPFVEDEIVEEPVVEELPEVVEDEVIM